MITINGCEECTHAGLCKYEGRMKETLDQMAVKNLNDGLGIPDFLQVHVRCKYFVQRFRGGYIVDKGIDKETFDKLERSILDKMVNC